jgi:VWFA-related protein
MILEHDGAVRVVRPFTADPRALEQTFSELEERPVGGASRERQRVALQRELVNTHANCPPQRGGMWGCMCDDLLLSRSRGYAAEARALRQHGLEGLKQAVAALGGLPGHTELLYIGGGMPAHAGLEIFHFLSDLCPPEAEFQNLLRLEMSHYSGMSHFRDVGAAANAHRVTLHSLDATGLEVPGSASVEHDLMERDHTGRGGRPSFLNDQIRKENRQGSLFALADETGGKAILDTSEPGWALELLAGEAAGAYVLGFSPGHPPEGAVHRVAVRAAGRDLQVRHRRSFRHATREETMGERTLATRILGVADNPWEVAAAWVAAGGGERSRRGVELRIPAAELTMMEGEDQRRGLVTVILAVPRADGAGSEVRRKDLTAHLVPGEDGVHLVVELDLPPGEHRLGVGVWDRLADRAAFLPVSTSVPEGEGVVHEASAGSPPPG